MPTTDRVSLVVQAHVDLITSRKATLGLADVWYGDQSRLPRTPADCVDAGPMERTLNRATGKGGTENTFRIYHLIYLGKVQDVQANLKQAQELAESIMTVLHEDITLGGLVLHGFVTTIEPGFVRKGDALMKVQRLAWHGMNQTRVL